MSDDDGRYPVPEEGEDDFTPEQYWQSYVDCARVGDPRAAGYLLWDLVRTLKGNRFESGTLESQAVRDYLVEVLEATLNAHPKDAGRMLKISNPKKRPVSPLKTDKDQLIARWIYDRKEKDGVKLVDAKLDAAIEFNKSDSSVNRLWQKWGKFADSFSTDKELQELLKDVPLPPPE